MATKKWTGVRPGIAADLGGEAVVAQARQRTQAYINANRLAERRTSLGLTQAEVAERMGVSKSRVSQIERGEGNPTLETLEKVGHAFGLTVRFVRRGDE